MRAVTALIGGLALVTGACDATDKPEADDDPPPADLRIGHVMVEVGHRFETAGRAASADRWPLAEYEVHEILEMFHDDMGRALLPGDCVDAVVDPLFVTLRDEQLPRLRDLAGEADEAEFRAQFQRVAASCNGCHAGCDVAFVEVPTEPRNDLVVPRLDAEDDDAVETDEDDEARPEPAVEETP